LILLRKLLDCCPFPQAKGHPYQFISHCFLGLLVDICRALFLQLAHKLLPLQGSSQNMTELKRAPKQPLPSSKENEINAAAFPPSESAIDPKLALNHIRDMQSLEAYHIKLDEYGLQYPFSDGLTLEMILSVCFDLYVLPALKHISSEYQSAQDVKICLALPFSDIS
jgi:hypothetical protein